MTVLLLLLFLLICFQNTRRLIFFSGKSIYLVLKLFWFRCQLFCFDYYVKVYGPQSFSKKTTKVQRRIMRAPNDTPF